MMTDNKKKQEPKDQEVKQNDRLKEKPVINHHKQNCL